MYAIIEDGSHQFRVREGDRIRVDRRDGKAGDELVFSKVLLDHGRKRQPHDRNSRSRRRSRGRQDRQSIQGEEDHHPEVPPTQKCSPAQRSSPAIHDGPDHQRCPSLTILALPAIANSGDCPNRSIMPIFRQRSGFFIFWTCTVSKWAADVTIVGAGRPEAGGCEGRDRWIDAGVMRLGVNWRFGDACSRFSPRRSRSCRFFVRTGISEGFPSARSIFTRHRRDLWDGGRRDDHAVCRRR